MKYHFLSMVLWTWPGLFAVCYANFMTPLIQKDIEWFILNNVGPHTELVSLIIRFSISEKLHLAEKTVFLKSSPLPRQKITWRSSRPEMSVKKDVLKNSAKFTGKHSWQPLFLIKFQAVGLQLYWKRLQHMRFPVSFAKFSGTLKMTNILGRLLLDRLNNQFLLHRAKVWNTHENLNLLFLIFFNIQYPLKVIVQYLLKCHYVVPSLKKPLQVNSAMRALQTLAGHLVILKYVLSCTIFTNWLLVLVA